MAKLNNLTKAKIISEISKRLNGKIHKEHIENVINIFFDEFICFLKKNIFIEIGKFGIFRWIKNKPRNHFDVTKNKIVRSEGKSKIKFKLNKKLTTKIIEKIKNE